MVSANHEQVPQEPPILQRNVSGAPNKPVLVCTTLLLLGIEGVGGRTDPIFRFLHVKLPHCNHNHM